MLYRCIQCENQKLRHSVIWSACILIPVIPAIMGTFNYLQNLELLKDGWYSLWTQLSLFYASIFYAPLIALYASYLWRLEHLNHNWNQIMTAPVPVPDLFWGKLTVIFQVTFLTQIWLGLLFFLCGKLSGLPGFPPAEILLWLYVYLLPPPRWAPCSFFSPWSSAASPSPSASPFAEAFWDLPSPPRGWECTGPIL